MRLPQVSSNTATVTDPVFVGSILNTTPSFFISAPERSSYDRNATRPDWSASVVTISTVSLAVRLSYTSANTVTTSPVESVRSVAGGPGKMSWSCGSGRAVGTRPALSAVKKQEKAAMLVVIAGLGNGQKRVLAVESGARESTASWSKILRDLQRRGLQCPKLVVSDGHLGIWGVLANMFPGTAEQRCWNHRILNGLDKLPKKAQGQAKILLTEIAYDETREAATRLKRAFDTWCARHGHQAAAILTDEWEPMVTFFSFPKAQWKHLRTTNPVEPLFPAVRLRTSMAKRYKKGERATGVIWRTLLVAEHNFRSVDAPSCCVTS
jgi:hypothetical protein